jgi:hypothetical protein
MRRRCLSWRMRPRRSDADASRRHAEGRGGPPICALVKRSICRRGPERVMRASDPGWTATSDFPKLRPSSIAAKPRGRLFEPLRMPQSSVYFTRPRANPIGHPRRRRADPGDRPRKLPDRAGSCTGHRIGAYESTAWPVAHIHASRGFSASAVAVRGDHAAQADAARARCSGAATPHRTLCRRGRFFEVDVRCRRDTAAARSYAEARTGGANRRRPIARPGSSTLRSGIFSSGVPAMPTTRTTQDLRDLSPLPDRQPPGSRPETTTDFGKPRFALNDRGRHRRLSPSIPMTADDRRKRRHPTDPSLRGNM